MNDLMIEGIVSGYYPFVGFESFAGAVVETDSSAASGLCGKNIRGTIITVRGSLVIAQGNYPNLLVWVQRVKRYSSDRRGTDQVQVLYDLIFKGCGDRGRCRIDGDVIQVFLYVSKPGRFTEILFRAVFRDLLFAVGSERLRR